VCDVCVCGVCGPPVSFLRRGLIAGVLLVRLVLRCEELRSRTTAPLVLRCDELAPPMPLENGLADERVSRGQASERAVCVCESVSVEMGAPRPPLPTAVLCPPGRHRLRLAITSVNQSSRFSHNVRSMRAPHVSLDIPRCLKEFAA